MKFMQETCHIVLKIQKRKQNVNKTKLIRKKKEVLAAKIKKLEKTLKLKNIYIQIKT